MIKSIMCGRLPYMDIMVHNSRLGLITVQVDDEDADLAQIRWHLAGGKGPVGKYVATGLPTQYMHRIIAKRMGLIGQVIGEGRSTVSIDHIDGNKFNNRRSNLAIRTRKEQMNNPNDELRISNTSGVRGVSFIQARAHLPTPWYASVMVDGKTKSLGMHPTREAAAEARRLWDTREV